MAPENIFPHLAHVGGSTKQLSTWFLLNLRVTTLTNVKPMLCYFFQVWVPSCLKHINYMTQFLLWRRIFFPGWQNALIDFSLVSIHIHCNFNVASGDKHHNQTTLETWSYFAFISAQLSKGPGSGDVFLYKSMLYVKSTTMTKCGVHECVFEESKIWSYEKFQPFPQQHCLSSYCS